MLGLSYNFDTLLCKCWYKGNFFYVLEQLFKIISLVIGVVLKKIRRYLCKKNLFQMKYYQFCDYTF